MVANEHKQLIVRFKQHYQSKFQQDLVDAWSLNAFSVVKLGATTDFQQTEMSHSNKDFWLVVEFIIPNSEGECHISKSTFGLIVKSILIPNDLINRIFEVAAVVHAFIYDTPGALAFKSRIRYSKKSLVFGVD